MKFFPIIILAVFLSGCDNQDKGLDEATELEAEGLDVPGAKDGLDRPENDQVSTGDNLECVGDSCEEALKIKEENITEPQTETVQVSVAKLSKEKEELKVSSSREEPAKQPEQAHQPEQDKQTQINNLLQMVKQKELEITQKNADILKKDGLLSQAATDLSNLETKFKQAQSDILKKDGLLSQATTDFNNVKAKLAKAISDISVKENLATQANNALNVTKGELDTANKELLKKEQLIEQLQQEKTEDGKKLLDAGKRLTLKNDQLNEREQEITKLKQQLGEENKSLQVNDELDRPELGLEKILEGDKGLAKQVKDLGEKLARAEKENNDLIAYFDPRAIEFPLGNKKYEIPGEGEDPSLMARFKQYFPPTKEEIAEATVVAVVGEKVKKLPLNRNASPQVKKTQSKTQGKDLQGRTLDLGGDDERDVDDIFKEEKENNKNGDDL